MNLQLIKRLIFGIAIGVFLAMLCWTYSAFCHVSISLFQWILGCLILAISWGIVAAISDPDTLLDNLLFFDTPTARRRGFLLPNPLTRYALKRTQTRASLGQHRDGGSID